MGAYMGSMMVLMHNRFENGDPAWVAVERLVSIQSIRNFRELGYLIPVEQILSDQAQQLCEFYNNEVFPLEFAALEHLQEEYRLQYVNSEPETRDRMIDWKLNIIRTEIDRRVSQVEDEMD